MLIVGVPGGGGPDGGGPATGMAVGAAGDFPESHAAARMQIARIEKFRMAPIEPGGATGVRISLRYHDWRRAVIGSTDAARRAGMKQASRPIAHSTSGTDINVIGSSAAMP